jgi:polyisoprenoid-binding protein YceI
LPVTLDVVINGEAEVEGTQKIAFTASTQINRKKWGISWNENLDKGGVAVSEEVKILIEGQANLIKNKTK